MAETMYSKIVLQRSESPTEASAFEYLADLLFEVGKGLLIKHEPSRAAKWLRRAMEILADQDMDLLSPDALELRLSIMHYLGTYSGLHEHSWPLTRPLQSGHSSRSVPMSLIRKRIRFWTHWRK